MNYVDILLLVLQATTPEENTQQNESSADNICWRLKTNPTTRQNFTLFVGELHNNKEPKQHTHTATHFPPMLQATKGTKYHSLKQAYLTNQDELEAHIYTTGKVMTRRTFLPQRNYPIRKTGSKEALF